MVENFHKKDEKLDGARMVIDRSYLHIGEDYDYYANSRDNFQAIYGNILKNEPGIAGRVLDIGCGHGSNPAYPYFSASIGQLDGVDPFPMVEPATNLTNRWTCPLEEIPVPDNTYDMAYSYNVVEHVKEIDGFLRKSMEIVKPGACYWSLSPNYHHPFSLLTRAIQRTGLLSYYRKLFNSQANDYPAFYVMSREENIVESIRRQGLPVAKVHFYYIPNVQWDVYFPGKLKFIAHMLDKLWILPNPKRSFIFAFRMERAL